MFRKTNTYIIEILSDGIKECKVRWPTDEEWAAFFRARRIVRRQLGGGRSVSEFPDNDKASAALLSKIRLDPDGAAFDDAEAEDVITRLTKCELNEVQRQGVNFVIDQAVISGDVQHVLRIPSSKQRRKHENASASSIDGNRERVTKIFIEPSGDLYDDIAVSSKGYEGEVPLIHKWAAVNALFEAIDAIMQEPRPEVSAPVA
jgi:hypothetical protein